MAIEEVTGDKIAALKAMPKRVTNPAARFRDEERYERKDFSVSGEGDHEFKIYWRRNKGDEDDFSCGIRWLMPSGETLTLARYNGPSHIHHDIKFKCHIHKATEEAIRGGKKPESYAEESTEYSTPDGALYCLARDFNVSGIRTEPDHPDLFR